MQEEFGKNSNADCRTLDSLCFAACGMPEQIDVKFSDQSFIHKYWPRTSNNIGAYCAKLKNMGAKEVLISSNFVSAIHEQTIRFVLFTKKLACKGQVWDASFEEYPLNQIVNDCASYGSCRYNCDVHFKLKPILDKYDVILVDEMQDLLSGQELRLIRQTSKPVVFIGDDMQAINTFRDDPPCDKCVAEPENLPILPTAFEWYGTWRLDSFTAKFVEERFSRPMYSYNMEGKSCIKWQSHLQHPTTLIMCRSNERVVEMLERFPDSYVINGRAICLQLKDAAKDDSMILPLSSFAQKLQKKKRLEYICQLLEEKSVSLVDVKDVPVVSTVHQIKGFEYDHCAIHNELLDADDEAEKNISFVAFTRHKKSLTVLT